MKMKPRDMQFMVGGLVVGLLVGLLASAAGLFGTAVDDNNSGDTAIEVDPSRFYTVGFNDAADWLDSVDPENSSELTEQIDTINGLAGGATDLSTFNPESLEEILLAMHNALLEEEGLGDDANVQTCIALDQDPYSLTGPGIYLYFTFPEDEGDNLPSEWTASDTPKEESIFWAPQCTDGTVSEESDES